MQGAKRIRMRGVIREEEVSKGKDREIESVSRGTCSKTGAPVSSLVKFTFLLRKTSTSLS